MAGGTGGDFSEDPPREAMPPEQLVLALEGFEGPIDLLLTMAREQKVDLARISMVQLVDQYLAVIAEARRVRLELAADWLVMAAWLAYLKSRLLLPEPETSADEPSGAEMAEALAFQLRRLEAMRESAARLMARPHLSRDFFPRGAPEGLAVAKTPRFEVTLYELLRAYADQRRRQDSSVLTIAPIELYSLEEALQRLSDLLGRLPDWSTLMSFLPQPGDGSLRARSALAAHFAASLELVKAGRLELRQDSPFSPLWLRRANRPPLGEG